MADLAPCDYNRRTVERVIDRFGDYEFRQLAGLCEMHLEPLLDHQVGEALRAGRGDVALAMLVPIVDFLTERSDLDDGYGEGIMFVSNWADRLGAAIERLEGDWENDELIEEMLESIAKIPSHWREKDMDEHCDGLRKFLKSSTDASGDDCEPHSKRTKRDKEGTTEADVIATSLNDRERWIGEMN